MAPGEGSSSWQKGLWQTEVCLNCALCANAWDPFVWLSTINVTDGPKQPWNPDLLCQASEAWQLLWKVEVSTCPPAVCSLVPGSMGSGHGYKSSCPPALEGEAPRLESWCSKHTWERLICRLTIDSQSTRHQSCRQQWEFPMSVLSIVYGNMCLCMLFFPFFKKCQRFRKLSVQWLLLYWPLRFNNF